MRPVSNSCAKIRCCKWPVLRVYIKLGKEWAVLFPPENFKIDCSSDMHSVELYGALKNVIALGAGARTWSENLQILHHYTYLYYQSIEFCVSTNVHNIECLIAEAEITISDAFWIIRLFHISLKPFVILFVRKRSQTSISSFWKIWKNNSEFISYSKHNIWELQLSNGNLNMNDKIRAAQIWCRNKVAWKLFFSFSENWGSMERTHADIYEGPNRGEYQGTFHSFFSGVISWLSFTTGFQNFF